MNIKHKFNLEGFEISSCNVPKKIWCYWNSNTLPPMLDILTSCWKSKLHTWTIHIITPETVDTYLSESDTLKKPTQLSPPHFADWLRLHLLRDHGGAWIDISTLIENESELDKYYLEFCKSGKEVFGFYMPWFQTNDKFAVLENYFLMAAPQSPFIVEWCKEFQHAIDIGFGKYRDEIVKDNIDPQKISEYHTQHLCAQKIMQKRGNPSDYILMYNSLDHVLYHQNKERQEYDRSKLQEELLNVEFRNQHPILKLTGEDRNLINEERFKELKCS